jgi:hypothetical protein
VANQANKDLDDDEEQQYEDEQD